jgi:hypothetical protein
MVYLVGAERRQYVHGENVQTPQRSALSIGALVTNYLGARKNPIQRKLEAWTCPHEGEVKMRSMQHIVSMVKINVHPAYSIDEGRGSARVIIRDFRGKFVAAQTK